MTVIVPPAPAAQTTRSASSVGGHGPVGWMVLPALGVFVAFGAVPLLGVLGLSFTTWDGLGVIHPSGLTSWRAVLTDPGLPHAMWVTFKIMALSWLFQTPMSMLIGVFLAGPQRYREFLAILYFIPLLRQDWLGDSTLALGVVVFVVSWQFIPFHSLIYQGAVRQIPRSMYEAAALDGAGRVRQFFSITLPQLKYTIITSSTLMVVGSLTFFDLIFVLTEGGPGDATRSLALEMYKTGFQANLMGPASAIAVILVVVGLIVALLLRRLGGRGDESQLEGA